MSDEIKDEYDFSKGVRGKYAGKVEHKITAITCGTQCSDGGEHQWDGPEVKLERGGSASCSKCGRLAIDVSMWL